VFRYRDYVILIIVLIIFLMSACAWRATDRCWIDDQRYKQVRELYLETASLEIVRQTLKDNYWTTPEINEAIYRLKKEFHLENAEQKQAH